MFLYGTPQQIALPFRRMFHKVGRRKSTHGFCRLELPLSITSTPPRDAWAITTFRFPKSIPTTAMVCCAVGLARPPPHAHRPCSSSPLCQTARTGHQRRSVSTGTRGSITTALCGPEAGVALDASAWPPKAGTTPQAAPIGLGVRVISASSQGSSRGRDGGKESAGDAPPTHVQRAGSRKGVSKGSRGHLRGLRAQASIPEGVVEKLLRFSSSGPLLSLSRLEAERQRQSFGPCVPRSASSTVIE
jgi:hypothetical protein